MNLLLPHLGWSVLCVEHLDIIASIDLRWSQVNELGFIQRLSKILFIITQRSANLHKLNRSLIC